MSVVIACSSGQNDVPILDLSYDLRINNRILCSFKATKDYGDLADFLYNIDDVYQSVIINNVTEEDIHEGATDYELKVNRLVVCSFIHCRGFEKLAECLGDAVDALEGIDKQNLVNLLQDARDSLIKSKSDFITKLLIMSRDLKV
jgi:hypothetical protein